MNQQGAIKLGGVSEGVSQRNYMTVSPMLHVEEINGARSSSAAAGLLSNIKDLRDQYVDNCESTLYISQDHFPPSFFLC